MSLVAVSAGQEVSATHINQFKDHLQGAAGDTEAYHLIQDTSAPFRIRLADNAGGTTNQFQILDSDQVVVVSADSDGVFTAIGGIRYSGQLIKTSISAAALLIGHTASIAQADGETGAIQLHGTDSQASLGMIRWSANAGSTGVWIGKSRGAAIGTNGIVVNGDTLGRIVFSGDDGTNVLTQGASIRATVAGTPGVNDMPTALIFATTADGAASLTDRMTIHADGSMTMAALGAQGAGTINAEAVYDNGVILTDFVFEPVYELLPISDMEMYYRANNHLPTIPGREAWEANGKLSLGRMTTHFWETLEVQALYIAELHNRLARLEGQYETH